MRAFVLSGGGNYGALQVGALKALLECGIQPDILVGVSAGALNAAFLAVEPTLERVQQLEHVWCDSTPKFFTRPNYVDMLLRLIRQQDGLLTNDSLQRFIRAWSPAEFANFRDIRQCQLYVIASRLVDGSMRVFGENDTDSLFDALMASTALPPLFPPWIVDGEAYVDGGVSSDLPILAAARHGADEIYALQVTTPPPHPNQAPPQGVVEILSQVFSTLIDRSVQHEIEILRQHRKVRLHLMRLHPLEDPGFWNFSQSADLIRDGQRQAEEYLASVIPASPRLSFASRIRQLIKFSRPRSQLLLPMVANWPEHVPSLKEHQLLEK